MNKHLQVAVAGFILLLPALLLVSTGLLGLERPAALVHPVLMMGSLLLTLTLNALSVPRVHFHHDDGNLVASIRVRLRGAAPNLTTLTVCCPLLATIAVYLFVENS